MALLGMRRILRGCIHRKYQEPKVSIKAIPIESTVDVESIRWHGVDKNAAISVLNKRSEAL